MLDEKQITQMQVMLKTLIEATDHLTILVQEKEFEQSVYIYSSLVEGAQAVMNALQTKSHAFVREIKNLEKYLIFIADEMQNGEFMKVAEVVQSSLLPLLVSMEGDFAAELESLKQD